MENKLGNPAVVGLAGFGLTTFLLQLHNLGVIGLGPVLWYGIFFGGLAQMIAGFLEFKTGNNFGFMAFTGYGIFWISLCVYILFGANSTLMAMYPKELGIAFSGPDLGYFLVGWTIFTAILFIGSLKHNGVLAIVFLTLLLGFIGLDIKEIAGSAMAGNLAAYDLIVCAFAALYLGAATVYGEDYNLPIGGPWVR
jgi:succinate-acetate transporter protein